MTNTSKPRKLSAPQVAALISIRDNQHAGPARDNTVTSLETAKLFRIRKNPQGGFDKLIITHAGTQALAAATAAPTKVQAAAAPVDPITRKTPAEIDTRAAVLDNQRTVTLRKIAANLDTVHRMVEGRPVRTSGSGKSLWKLSDDDAVTALRRQIDDNEFPSTHGLPDALGAWETVGELRVELDIKQTEADALEAEYKRRPWNRYVQVPGGHIHSGAWCAGGSISYTTERHWAPQLAGKSVARAVAELGARLCTHCFPSAPVEWTAAATKPVHCAGSGRSEVSGTYRRGGAGRGTCRECGTAQTMTSRGLIRAHAPKA